MANKIIDVVSTVSNAQCLHLDDFIKALIEVDGFYYTYTTQKKVKKYPERVFAYELYHQFRKIMEKNRRNIRAYILMVNNKNLNRLLRT